MIVVIEDPARMEFVGTSGLGHMHSTYILQSDKDGRYYIGSAENIDKRITRHNEGYSRYTKGRGPFKLVYQEGYNNASDAKKREYYLKSLKSRKALEKLINGPIV